ncbi:hypothetical protein BDA96_01G220100, partial [Sorghum bicolor]
SVHARCQPGRAGLFWPRTKVVVPAEARASFSSFHLWSLTAPPPPASRRVPPAENRSRARFVRIVCVASKEASPSPPEQQGCAGMEKYNSNTQFAPLRETPFALRGALGSSSSYPEQARGYTSSPLAALQPKMSTPGNRLLHTSRPLSSPVANRPLSPHLPLKKPQFSATFSISHRIFGVALGVAIISVPLATKFSLMFGV